MARGDDKRQQTRPARGTAMGIVAVVAVTAFYIGFKVELDGLARQLDRTQKACAGLEEERVKLAVAIDAKKKSGKVRQAALKRLGMIYPAGWIELDKR